MKNLERVQSLLDYSHHRTKIKLLNMRQLKIVLVLGAVIVVSYGRSTRPISADLKQPLGAPVSPTEQKSASADSQSVVKIWIFQQIVDHFEPSSKTFEQFYLTNDAFYTPGGPVFLYLLGPWSTNRVQLLDTFVATVSRANSAFLISVEYRYYGSSYPVLDMAGDNMKYLTTAQAIEDTVYFVEQTKVKFNLTGPWFLIGGITSANLAVWIKAKYPDMFYGVWASSAPLLASVGFPEYYELVGHTMEEVASTECTAVLYQATDELEHLVEIGDSESIRLLFDFCSPPDLRDPLDVMYLYDLIANHFRTDVIYGTEKSIKQRCDDLIQGKDTPLGTVARMFRDTWTVCFSIDCQSYVSQSAQDTSFDMHFFKRQWYWQQCTEYGLFWTLTSDKQPFGQNVPMDYYEYYCTQVYGEEYNLSRIEEGVKNTNEQYGGLTPNVTRVLFTYGSNDPWRERGVLQELNPESPVILIEGSNMANDLKTPKEDDSQGLQDARDEILKIMYAWVNAAMKETRKI